MRHDRQKIKDLISRSDDISYEHFKQMVKEPIQGYKPGSKSSLQPRSPLKRRQNEPYINVQKLGEVLRKKTKGDPAFFESQIRQHCDRINVTTEILQQHSYLLKDETSVSKQKQLDYLRSQVFTYGPAVQKSPGSPRYLSPLRQPR